MYTCFRLDELQSGLRDHDKDKKSLNDFKNMLAVSSEHDKGF